MREVFLNGDISNISDDNATISILKQNNVSTVRDIWKSKRIELKNMGLSDSQINGLIIKLQLNGLDINSKVYNKI